MRRRITLALDAETLSRLAAIAQQERRDTRAQAAVMLEELVKARPPKSEARATPQEVCHA